MNPLRSLMARMDHVTSLDRQLAAVDQELTARKDYADAGGCPMYGPGLGKCRYRAHHHGGHYFVPLT